MLIMLQDALLYTVSNPIPGYDVYDVVTRKAGMARCVWRCMMWSLILIMNITRLYKGEHLLYRDLRKILIHDDVIKWKHFPCYWPFEREIHQSPVNTPHKGQWRRALKFSLICVWTNSWINNGEAGDLRRYRAHYDLILMLTHCIKCLNHCGLLTHTATQDWVNIFSGNGFLPDFTRP